MDTVTADKPRGVGDNSGATDAALLLDPDLITDQLAIDYKHHTLKRDELLRGVARLVIQYGTIKTVAELPEAGTRGEMICAGPQALPHRWDNGAWTLATPDQVIAALMPSVTIPDEQSAAKLTSFIKQMKDVGKVVEADRVRTISPYNGAADAVQTFFKKNILDYLLPTAKGLEGGPLNRFQRKRAQDERDRREAEARKAREEANHLVAAAQRTEHADVIDTAVQATTVADRAEQRAAAPVADVARIGGSVGGTASGLTQWKYEVTDERLLPQRFWIIDHSALAAEVKRDKAACAIPGIRVFDELKTSVR